MIDPTTLTDELLSKSLKSTTCPCCGKKKKFQQTLCVFDYHRLPREKAYLLYYLNVGVDVEKYRPAVIDALEYLQAKIFHLPAIPATSGVGAQEASHGR